MILTLQNLFPLFQIHLLRALHVDLIGNIYFSDTNNQRIGKITNLSLNCLLQLDKQQEL